MKRLTFLFLGILGIMTITLVDKNCKENIPVKVVKIDKNKYHVNGYFN